MWNNHEFFAISLTLANSDVSCEGPCWKNGAHPRVESLQGPRPLGQVSYTLTLSDSYVKPWSLATLAWTAIARGEKLTQLHLTSANEGHVRTALAKALGHLRPSNLARALRIFKENISRNEQFWWEENYWKTVQERLLPACDDPYVLKLWHIVTICQYVTKLFQHFGWRMSEGRACESLLALLLAIYSLTLWASPVSLAKLLEGATQPTTLIG